MAKVTALKQKQEEKQGFSIDDVLSTATQPKEAKSSKTPLLTVPKDVMEKVARLREIREELDSLESEWDLLSADTVALVEPMRVDLIKRQGYTSSVKVPDMNGLSATISWSAKYSAVDLSNGPAIEEAIGKDRAHQFFTREMKISVKDVTEDALRDLIQSVGPERFAQFFAVERWLSPTKAYTEQFYAAFNEKERAALAPIVRQYKPSVKVK